MLARDDIVTACDEVVASKTAREAVKGVHICLVCGIFL